MQHWPLLSAVYSSSVIAYNSAAVTTMTRCRCDFVLDAQGAAKPFPKKDQDTVVNNVIEPMAKDGLRTISLAYKDYVPGAVLTNKYWYRTNASLERMVYCSMLYL